MNQRVFPSKQLAGAIASDAAALIQQKLKTRPRFNLVLTGGTLGIETVKELGMLDLDWSRVEIWLGDERFVELDSADRNEGQAIAVWPRLAELNLHRFPSPEAHTLTEAAAAFSMKFESEFGELAAPDSVFDLVLLGMGPDGHVASLFPGVSHGPAWVVAEADSPKPPSERLSLSYEALNRADEVWFLVSGVAKADALREALAGSDLPAAKVSGMNETVWYLDQEISDAL